MYFKILLNIIFEYMPLPPEW